MNENERPSYFATISADVRYDKRLRANEKLLYGEITALCNKTGECWASNKYFADLYGVTTQAVSKWITNLRQCGYISVNLTYKEGTKEIERRIIKLSVASRNDVTSDCEVVTRDLGVVTNDCEGMVQKVKENNTSINNTSEYINIKESKKEDINNAQIEHVEKSTCSKKKKNTLSYDDLVSAYTQNEELQNALKAFLQMRSFIKKPMTEYALKLMLKKLDELGNDDSTKIAIINRSITHNWQGIFPLSNEHTKQEKQPEKKYDQNGYESEKELMAKFYGK